MGSEFSNKRLIYIGSFAIKEDIKREEQKTYNLYYLVATILLLLIGVIIYKSTTIKEKKVHDKLIKEIYFSTFRQQNERKKLHKIRLT